MPDEQQSLFAAVDALLEEAAAQDALPHPDERKRLREAAGLSQDQIAKALSVRRETVTSWETGRTDPRPPKRAAYTRLLDGLATLHPVNAVNAPTPNVRPAPAPTEPTVNAVNAGPTPPPAIEAPQAPPSPAPPEHKAPGGAPQTPPSPASPAFEARSLGRSPRNPTADQATPPAPAPALTPTAPSSSPAPQAAPTPQPTVNAVNATPPPPAPPAFEARSLGRSPSTPAGDKAHTPTPLAVLDAQAQAHTTNGLILPLPPKAATDLPTLIAWALSEEADLRSPRLHRNGKDGDPLLVLTPEATEALGLPLTLEDRRGLRLPDNHPVVRQLAKSKWQLTRRGFGPWARVYRPASPTTGRQCVQLAVLPWAALDPRAWGEETANLPAPELALLLTTYATRVLTPRGSTAVTGLELMTALRPPTRAARNPETNLWESAPVPGSLTRPVDPAPPEAPDEHPVVAALYPRAHQRTPDQVLDEEAYDWIRDPELLTDAECARTHAVGIDVNMAFAAAANRLTVGLGPAVHTPAPRFDPKVPGCWLADLSALSLDPRLPSPFTPHGKPPTGPAWYATPTLAYAQELGHRVEPAEAWLRPDNGSYLDAWYTRLRDAYVATMADLGVTPDLTDEAFLEAMSVHKQKDPALAAVLSAIKATVKGGIGKLRERPQGAGYRPGEAWPALERPTWRPDIRAAVISTARVNMHRKMRKLATAADLYPIAVLSDCAVYLSDGPSPLDFLPRTPDGKPLPGGFRLGVSPGMVKHEGTQPLLWAVGLLDEGHNPARHIKGHDAASDGE
ncbi:helix-turn-helix domain-containing protein (plasmid) [Streptomyces sp. NBC_00536]|uniref:telomere-associated protein Tap n=1 Tax=Streptomyces sp. NBC_00536 TaxID=2975769 RepID=UPI002E7FE3AF|nr:helix-turn-helix domain-containing protein [Streptomyces sp. NBC_00536]WUC84293.1 helix-turn-helix domain-containing protein [Streptomyces sp. NBC_00536]